MKRLLCALGAFLILTSVTLTRPVTAAAPAPLIFARVKDAVDLDPAVATDGLSLNVTSLILQGLVAFKSRHVRRRAGI